jgi:hypothetical protein
MSAVLAQDRPYERFSTGLHGLAPAITVALHLPASGRIIRGKRALIDSGCEVTQLYPRDIHLDLDTDVESDPGAGLVAVRIEIAGRVYAAWCAYEDHPSAGTEEMLIGMDLLENWLVTLDGPRRLLSITHP